MTEKPQWGSDVNKVLYCNPIAKANLVDDSYKTEYYTQMYVLVANTVCIMGPAFWHFVSHFDGLCHKAN